MLNQLQPINLTRYKNKENDSFTPCMKELFHTTTKKQTGYSRFAILISTILVTKHPFFFENFTLSPPECSVLSSRIFYSSSPGSVLMKPWISLSRKFFLY